LVFWDVPLIPRERKYLIHIVVLLLGGGVVELL